jgi:hypothetical protein
MGGGLNVDTKALIEKMASVDRTVPDRADVLALRQYSVSDMERRLRRLLATTGESCGMVLDRGDWQPGRDRTLVRLPLGGRAAFYHASGAMKLVMGLAPLEHCFDGIPDRRVLTDQVEAAARPLKLNDWLSRNASLRFERLWQLKAQAAGRDGQTTAQLLCRVVGAYRHFVGELPVWGPAAVAVKLAAGGTLDSLVIHLREPSGEVVERAKVLPPEHAARAVAAQLRGLLGHSRSSGDGKLSTERLRFGYLSLPKRKPQRVLAPVYVGTVQIEGRDEAQAYHCVVPATEECFQSLCLAGSEARPAPQRRAG